MSVTLCSYGYRSKLLTFRFSLIIRLQKSIGKDENAAERLQKLRDSLPMKRITEPSDIANAAWYLGTEQSSFVTGTILEVLRDHAPALDMSLTVANT
jgi:NAD(P)-dependent dehydrogenase (short-subunit alcohol dehydrogenase family)